MSQRDNKEQKTIKQDLEKAAQLRPTIQSGGLNSYAFAREGHVERDRMAGGNWGRLAASLSSFDSSLSSALLRKADKDINEGAARGAVEFSENPDVEKNMKDWAQVVAADPDKYGSLSPYVRIGYEKARMKANAIAFDADIKEFYNTSNLVNEQDPEKINAAFQKFRSEWIAGKGLDKYEDKLLLAENFTALTARSVAGVMDNHVRQRESQRLEMLEQQVFENMASEVKNLQNIGIGGASLNVPRERRNFVDSVVSRLESYDAQFDKLGIPQSRRMGLVHKFVMGGDFNAATAEAIAKSYSTAGPDGKKLSLINQPGVAHQIRDLKDKEEARAMRKEAQALQREAREQARTHRLALGNGAAYGQDNDDFSYETVVVEKKLCSPADYDTFKKHAVAAYSARSAPVKTPNDSRESAHAYNMLTYKLTTGEAGMGDVLHYSEQGASTESVNKLMDLAKAYEVNAQSGLKESTDFIMKSVIAAKLGISAEEAQGIVNIQNNGGKLTVADHLAAFNEGAAAATEFRDKWETERKNAQREHLPKDVTRDMAQKFVVERNSRDIEQRKQTKQSKELTDIMRGMGGEVQSKQKMVERGPGVLNNWGGAMPAQYSASPAWNRSIQAFNTLMPDYVWEDARGTAIQPKTVTDLITTLHRAQPNATWADFFFVLTGSRPDALNVRSETEARAYLEQYRKNIHKNKEVF